MIQGKRWLAALVLATVARGACASEGFDAENWKPALDPYGYVTVGGARSLGTLQAHGALYFNWAHDPLKLSTPRAGGLGRDVIRDLSVFDLVLALGLLDIGEHGGLEIGAALPYAVDVNGTTIDVDPATGRLEDLREASFGNLRTGAKLSLLDRESDPVGLAVRGEVQWPTGRAADFLSNGKHVTWNLGLVLEKKIGPVRFAVEALYEGMPTRIEVHGAVIDDKLKVGAGVAFAPLDAVPLELVGEVFHSTRFARPWHQEAESPAEVGAALKYGGTLFAMLGASTGLDHGVGAAEERVYVAIGVTF